MEHCAIHTYADIISVITSDLEMEEKRLSSEITNGVLGEKTYITRNTSDKNHRNHGTQKNYDNDRIYKTKPMDARIEYMKIVVPASSLFLEY